MRLPSSSRQWLTCCWTSRRIVVVGSPTALGGHFGGMERTPADLERIADYVTFIRDGEIVCIFAEGQISRTGQMLPFRKGFEQSLWVAAEIIAANSRASLALMAAEELGIPYDKVRAIIADTSSLGYNDVTDGSRTTFSASSQHFPAYAASLTASESVS